MRKYYLDNIRWITIVLVVIYHVLYMYNSEGILGGLGKITNLEVQYYDAFQYLVYPWFMPVLFVVSGISSSLYLEKYNENEYIKSRTAKLLVPSTLGLFFLQFLQGYISMSLGNAFEKLKEAGVPKIAIFFIMVASGSGVLWFCHLLWIYSILLILFRKLEKGKLQKLGAHTPIWLIVLFSFLIWGAGQILNTPIIAVYRFGFYFVFFFLGYYIFSREEVMESLKKYAEALIIIAVSFCVLFTILYFGDNYADKPINRGALYAFCAYFGSLAVLVGMEKYGDFCNSFTKWMSRRSFGLYVFHYLGISSVALFIAKPKILSAPLCYFLSLVMAFVFGFGLYAIISQIPVYRWLVLGIQKKSKNDYREKIKLEENRK